MNKNSTIVGDEAIYILQKQVMNESKEYLQE